MTSLRSPTGILSFPALWVAKTVANNNDPRFSCNVLFDEAAQKSDEWQVLRRGILDAIEVKWPGKSKDRDFVRSLRLPFRRCSEKKYAGYDLKNGVYFNAWSRQRPGVLDARKNEIHLASDVWAGQLVKVSVHPFAYSQSGNQGVGFNLNNVQIVKKDMPRLDGRKSAQEDFDDLGGSEGEDDDKALMPAGADDDEPPF